MVMSTVLITGANRGIGYELARQYAQAGASVHATTRDSQSNALRQLRKSVTVHELEVTSEQSIAALKQKLQNVPIDILINNAGIKGPERQTPDDMDYKGWAETFAVNTIAPLRLIAAFKKNLLRSPVRKIVTITSQLGSITNNHGGLGLAYRTSKAAANQLMKSLAHDYAGDGIISVALHPGWVRTDMGGPHAPLSAAESAAGIISLIDHLKQGDSGSFLQWDGGKLPW